MVSVFASSSVVMWISSGSVGSWMSFSVASMWRSFSIAVRGVGDQLAEENLLVGVEGVDDEIEQLLDLGLEGVFFGGWCRSWVKWGWFVGTGRTIANQRPAVKISATPTLARSFTPPPTVRAD